MIGRTLSHCTVLEELSWEGMSIAYRALDVKLERKVAPKVLPPERVANPDRMAYILSISRESVF